MPDLKDISQVIDSASEEYNKASFKVIRQLQEKVSKLESENESLKHLLEQNTPTLIDTKDLGFGISHEELICATQISLLKDAAISRVLTLEEVKKLEILTKVKVQFETRNPNSDSISAEQMHPDALMQIVQNGST